MKLKKTLAAFAAAMGMCLAMAPWASAEDIAVDETNFPDANFRSYVSENIDNDKNGSLSQEEIDMVDSIDVYKMNIGSLKGIEFFTNMYILECSHNQLTSLDVSKNTYLWEMSCSYNQLTSLDVSKNTALGHLDCSYNQLTSLNVSGCTSLETLFCPVNQLTSLDVSKNTYLWSLSCSYNQLTNLDLSNNTALYGLACSYNQLTSLDVSKNPELCDWCCDNNSYAINVRGNTFPLSSLPAGFDPAKASAWTGAEYDSASNSLVNITAAEIGYTYDCGNGGTAYFKLKVTGSAEEDIVAVNETNFPDANFRSYVSQNIDKDGNGSLSQEEINSVKEIDVYNMNIGSLKGIEFFTNMYKLDCSKNNLTSLDLSGCTALDTLYCHTNQLDSLDLSKNDFLKILYCSDNNLTSLDVSGLVRLNEINCPDNYITELDLSRNTRLRDVKVHNNLLRILKLPESSDTEYNMTVDCYGNELTCLDLPSFARVYEYYRGTSFPAGDVGETYCLDGLAEYGFDPSRASGWKNAEYDPSTNSLINITSNKVTYSYKCNETETLPFTIYFNSFSVPDPIANFVERLYVKLLNRPSEAAGKADWTNQLKNGATATEVSSGFVLSEELAQKNLSNTEFVSRMYRTFMNREPDEGGLADWTNALDSGCSYAFVLNSFVLSAEFGNICNTYGIETGRYEITEPRDVSRNLTAFTSRMYTKALNREYEVDGLNYWTGRYINREISLNDMAYGFIFSEEFTNRNLSNEQYVDTLYATFFDRPADADGKADWLNRMHTQGYSREDVLNGFLGAEEFGNLVDSFGLN